MRYAGACFSLMKRGVRVRAGLERVSRDKATTKRGFGFRLTPGDEGEKGAMRAEIGAVLGHGASRSPLGLLVLPEQLPSNRQYTPRGKRLCSPRYHSSVSGGGLLSPVPVGCAVFFFVFINQSDGQCRLNRGPMKQNLVLISRNESALEYTFTRPILAST